jgi:hypothetical protein
LPAFFKCFAGIVPVLQRILVAARCARSWRAAVHAATSFPAHRRRQTPLARACFRPTAAAGKHRAGVTRMVGRHPFYLRVRASGTGSGFANNVPRSLWRIIPYRHDPQRFPRRRPLRRRIPERVLAPQRGLDSMLGIAEMFANHVPNTCYLRTRTTYLRTRTTLISLLGSSATCRASVSASAAFGVFSSTGAV